MTLYITRFPNLTQYVYGTLLVSVYDDGDIIVTRSWQARSMVNGSNRSLWERGL